MEAGLVLLGQEPGRRGGGGDEGLVRPDIGGQETLPVGVHHKAGSGHRVDQGIGLLHHHVQVVHAEFEACGVDLVADRFEPVLAGGEVLRVYWIGAVGEVPGPVVDHNVPEAAGPGVLDHRIGYGLGEIDEEVGLHLLRGSPGPHAAQGGMGQAVLDFHLFDDVQEIRGRAAEHRDGRPFQPHLLIRLAHQQGVRAAAGGGGGFEVEGDHCCGVLFVAAGAEAGADLAGEGQGQVRQLKGDDLVVVHRGQFQGQVPGQGPDVDLGPNPGVPEFHIEEPALQGGGGRAEPLALHEHLHEGLGRGQIVLAGSPIHKGVVAAVNAHGPGQVFGLQEQEIPRCPHTCSLRFLHHGGALWVGFVFSGPQQSRTGQDQAQGEEEGPVLSGGHGFLHGRVPIQDSLRWLPAQIRLGIGRGQGSAAVSLWGVGE